MSKIFPAAQLSRAGNLLEFQIPDTELGKVICDFHLVWGRVNGAILPCILHPAVRYSRFQPITDENVFAGVESLYTTYDTFFSLSLYEENNGRYREGKKIHKVYKEEVFLLEGGMVAWHDRECSDKKGGLVNVCS